MAAADEAVLLNSVCQELGSTKRKSDLGKQVRQQRLPLVPVMMDPGKHGLKHLHRCRKLGTQESLVAVRCWFAQTREKQQQLKQ